MSRVVYFVVTFLDAVLSVFGIRTAAVEPYTVEAKLGGDIEIRRYGATRAAQTRAEGDDFKRLFDYIGGANARGQTIAMTAPVEQHGGKLAPPAPGAEAVMRFYLPPKVAADPPPPRDASVSLVPVPARTAAVISFSGSLDRVQAGRYARILTEELARARRQTIGEPYLLGYDPPFTIPFLRRNEIAVDLAPAST